MSKLQVGDQDALVTRMIDQAPRHMMLRELFRNAIEAFTEKENNQREIEIRPAEIDGVPKLAIWNNGVGMDAEKLRHVCDISASLKGIGRNRNYGVGAKVTSLPNNRYGMRYRSCHAGKVAEVYLHFNEEAGFYERMDVEIDGIWMDVWDATQLAISEGYDLSHDWTEVVLMGNDPQQDTTKDPYAGTLDVATYWIPLYLWLRFFRLPEDVKARIGRDLVSTQQRSGDSPMRMFLPIGHHLDVGRFTNYEVVETDSGLRIHYIYDETTKGRANNRSRTFSLVAESSTSLLGLVYKDEMFNVHRHSGNHLGNAPWSMEAPRYGITYGAKNISVLIELPDNHPVEMDQYRTQLVSVTGDQASLHPLDFVTEVQGNIPKWLKTIIDSKAPKDDVTQAAVDRELRKFIQGLQLSQKRPLPSDDGQTDMAETDTGGGGSSSGGNGGGGSTGGGRTPGYKERIGGSLQGKSVQAKLAVPEFHVVRDQERVNELGLQGVSARYVVESNTCFINAKHTAYTGISERIANHFPEIQDRSTLMDQIHIKVNRFYEIHLGKAIVLAIYKRRLKDWVGERWLKALSPETLTIVAENNDCLLDRVKLSVANDPSVRGLKAQQAIG